ncbi:MAG: tRNA nucleotidyltransferase [Clostridia bacterium]|nr:tRNA nucleotidyltransferase [Clostridia bacterium]
MDRTIGARIPAYVRAVTDALAAAGHRGYLVGGSLRDLLRGVAPHDYDLTTDATPDEMLAAFASFRVIPTGLKHGTLTVLSEGQPVEVTTHRVDGGYTDGRHPDRVSFTRRLADDLSRRDFTVNAMAYSDQTGLVDLFDGQGDLARGIIRAVGDPATRFSEDALRILRAYRFSAQLDFALDESTAAGARAVRAGLSQVSVERIFSELTRLLASPAAARGMQGLLDADLAPFVFGDLAPDRTALAVLDTLPPRAEVRLAALLADHGEDALYALCRRLKTPNAFADALVGTVCAARAPLPDSPYAARHFAHRYWGMWQDGLSVAAARGAAVERAAELCRRVVRENSVIEVRRLAVNGRELQEQLGVCPAKTGALLLGLQDFVFADPARNKKATLLAHAAEICEKEKGYV